MGFIKNVKKNKKSIRIGALAIIFLLIFIGRILIKGEDVSAISIPKDVIFVNEERKIEIPLENNNKGGYLVVYKYQEDKATICQEINFTDKDNKVSIENEQIVRDMENGDNENIYIGIFDDTTVHYIQNYFDKVEIDSNTGEILKDDNEEKALLKKITLRADYNKPVINKDSIKLERLQNNQVVDSKNILMGDKVRFTFTVLENETLLNKEDIKLIINNEDVEVNDISIVNKEGNEEDKSKEYTVNVDFLVDKYVEGKDDKEEVLKGLSYKLYCKDEAGNSSEEVEGEIKESFLFDNFKITEENIQSSNEDKTIAKDGDTLTYSFTTSRDIDSKNIKVKNDNNVIETKVSKEDNDSSRKWIVEYTIINGKEAGFKHEEDIPLNVEIYNEEGELLSVIGEKVSNIKYYEPLKIEEISFIDSNNQVVDCIKDDMFVNIKVKLNHKVEKAVVTINGGEITTEEEANGDGLTWVAKLTWRSNFIATNGEKINYEVIGEDKAKNVAKINYLDEAAPELIYFNDIGLDNVVFTSSDTTDQWRYIKEGSILTVSFESIHEVESLLELNNSKENFNLIEEQHQKLESGKNLTVLKYKIGNLGLDSMVNVELKLIVKHKLGIEDYRKNSIQYIPPLIIYDKSVFINNMEIQDQENVFVKRDDEIKIKFSTNNRRLNCKKINLECSELIGDMKEVCDGDYYYYELDFKIKNDISFDNKKLKLLGTFADEYGMETTINLEKDFGGNIYYYHDINISNLEFKPTNNLSFAKDGEEVKLSFYSNHPIEYNNINIIGISEGKEEVLTSEPLCNNSETTSENGKYLCEATYKISPNDNLDDNSSIKFSFEAYDKANNVITVNSSEEKSNTYTTYYAPIKISNLKFTSNNSEGNNIAIKNDVVNLEFTTNHQVEIKKVVIAGTDVKDIKETNGKRVCSYKIKGNESSLKDDRPIDFEIFLTDAANNSLKREYANEKNSTIYYYKTLEVKDVQFFKEGNENKICKNNDKITIKFSTTHGIKKDSFAQITSIYTDKEGNIKNSVIKDNISLKEEVTGGKYIYTGEYVVEDNKFEDNGFIGFNLIVSDVTLAKNTNFNQDKFDSSLKLTYYAPIKINNLSFESNNGKKDLAKNGDGLEITFNTTHPVYVNTSTIAGKVIEAVTTDNKNWTISCFVEDGFVEDNSEIPFEITVGDNAGNEEVTKNQEDTSKVVYYAPIEIKDLSFQSSNGRKDLAKNGDNVEIVFNTTHPVNISSVVIAGKDGKIENTDNKSWRVSYVVENNCVEDDTEIPFEIVVGDNAGNEEVTKNEEDTLKVVYYAPIEIKDLTFQSDNEIKNLAKNGNEVEIAFSTSHPVNINSVTIAGKDGKIETSDNKSWKVSYVVENNCVEDDTEIPFEIVVGDNAGNEEATKNEEDASKVVYYAPIAIKDLSFQSNNGRKDLAKNGDKVEIAFSTSHPVNINSVTIAGKDGKIETSDNKSWKVSYVVENNCVEDDTEIPFEIVVGDNAGNEEVSKTKEDTSRVIYYAPIEIRNFSFTSNNEVSGAIAKNGNVITMRFNTSHPVNLKNITIANTTANISTVGNKQWEITYTVANGDTADQGFIDYYLKAGDDAGNSDVDKSRDSSNEIRYYAPINISNTKITTTNGNDGNKYAKDGDTVYVTFNTNHDVYLTEGKIASRNVIDTLSGSGSSGYTLSYQLSNGDISDLGDVTFNFAASDVAGNDVVAVNTYDNNVTNRIQYFAPITLTSTIASNNENRAYAKNGSRIALDFITNHNTTVVSADIFGRASEISGNGSTNLNASLTIPAGEVGLIEGVAPFYVTVTDLGGNYLSFNETNDNSSVIYDRTSPIVNLAPDFSGFTKEDITYTVSFSDTNLNPSGLSVLINGVEQITDVDRANAAGNTNYTKTVTVSNENEYDISANVVDYASNAAESNVGAKVTIDKTNPEITTTNIDINTPGVFKSGFVIADYFNINEAYIKEIVCKVTDNSGSNDWDINTPIMTDGKKTIYLLVTDMAENTSKAVTYDLYIDGTAPKAIVKEMNSGKELSIGENSDAFLSNMTLNVSLAKLHIANEAVDKFTKLQLLDKDGNLVKDLLEESPSSEGQYSYKIDKFGKYKLVVSAEDQVGNTIDDVEYEFTFKDKSLFMKIYSNKPLFYTGNALIVVLLGAFIIRLITLKKRREDQLDNAE